MAENKGKGTEAPKPDGPSERGRGKVEEDKFLYAIAINDGSNDDNLKLQKPVAVEREILRVANRAGVGYYRLQKFVPSEVDSPEGLLIVGVPAD